MKEFDNLENQLRSWKPRQPSPSVKQNIFGSAVSSTAIDPYAGLGEWFTLRWLAPAMACLVIALLTVSQRDPRFQGMTTADHWIMGTITPSNRNFSVHAPIRFDMDQTALENAKFEITNRNLTFVTNNFTN